MREPMLRFRAVRAMWRSRPKEQPRLLVVCQKDPASPIEIEVTRRWQLQAGSSLCQHKALEEQDSNQARRPQPAPLCDL